MKGVGDPTIQGYATSMSVNVGETENFKIKTPASSYHIDILRLGYYGGDGARLIASGIKPTAKLPQTQPECLHELVDRADRLRQLGRLGVVDGAEQRRLGRLHRAPRAQRHRRRRARSCSWCATTPATRKSCCRPPTRPGRPTTPTAATASTRCTVACPPGNPKAYKGAYSVSYNRPFDGLLRPITGPSYLYYAEYQMICWLEKNGYNVSYTSEAEVDQQRALLKNHKVFMSSGHDEYWSAAQRANVEAAREAGVNLAFFSGNEMFWKTRWGPSTKARTRPTGR